MAAPPGERTPFEEIGAERLRQIVDRFVDRVFDDVMIGFFFRHANKKRVKEKELELAAHHLGADVAYTGRPLKDVHGKLPIMGGQFQRRLRILEQTLDEMGAPPRVKAVLLDATERLRGEITSDRGGECDPGAAAQRAWGEGEQR